MTPNSPKSRHKRRRAERYGRLAESVAALFLQAKGYRVLARRYKTPLGEIDLVVRRGRAIAFVEVKARADGTSALAAITPYQRTRSARAALAWLMRHPEAADYDLRFDVVLVRTLAPPRHIANAWNLEEAGIA